MRELAEHCAEFTLRTLLPKKRAMYVDVEIKNILKEGALGLAWSVKDGIRISTIELHNKPESLYDFVEVLTHECVHIKQATVGDWHTPNGKMCWQGVDHSDTPYRKQPWEVEAYKMQKPLAKAYLKHIGYTMKAAKGLSARKVKRVGGEGWDERP